MLDTAGNTRAWPATRLKGEGDATPFSAVVMLCDSGGCISYLVHFEGRAGERSYDRCPLVGVDIDKRNRLYTLVCLRRMIR